MDIVRYRPGGLVGAEDLVRWIEAGEELRLGEESRAVLVAEPDEGRLSVTVEVHFPPELARRIRGDA